LEYAGNICRKITPKFFPRLNSTFQVLWHNEHSLNCRWSLDAQSSIQELKKKSKQSWIRNIGNKIPFNAEHNITFRHIQIETGHKKKKCVFAGISNATW
jgi:hypothetical protein